MQLILIVLPPKKNKTYQKKKTKLTKKKNTPKKPTIKKQSTYWQLYVPPHGTTKILNHYPFNPTVSKAISRLVTNNNITEFNLYHVTKTAVYFNLDAVRIIKNQAIML